MKYTNKALVELFVESATQAAGKESHTGNLWVSHDGNRLMNYGTCLVERTPHSFPIGEQEPPIFIQNATKYSSTTSKIQSLIRRELVDYILMDRVHTLNNININTSYLSFELYPVGGNK